MRKEQGARNKDQEEKGDPGEEDPFDDRRVLVGLVGVVLEGSSELKCEGGAGFADRSCTTCVQVCELQKRGACGQSSIEDVASRRIRIIPR